MSIRNLASILSLAGLILIGCDRNPDTTMDTPAPQPTFTDPPVTDPDPAQRGGVGSGEFRDPGVVTPGGTSGVGTPPVTEVPAGTSPGTLPGTAP